MREVNVFIKEKNYDINIMELCPECYDELLRGRIFETLDEMQDYCRVLKKHSDPYSQAMAKCPPAELNYILSAVEKLPKYE